MITRHGSILEIDPKLRMVERGLTARLLRRQRAVKNELKRSGKYILSKFILSTDAIAAEKQTAGYRWINDRFNADVAAVWPERNATAFPYWVEEPCAKQ